MIGKTIRKDTEQPYKITGICKDVPENSHLTFSYLLSYVTFYKSIGWDDSDHSFASSDFWHYIQLSPVLIIGS